MKKYDVIVIGGGAAGLMAAGAAANKGARVLVIEKNDSFGKKLLLTGGGRCNLTNQIFDTREFLAKFGDAGKFLSSTFSKFGVRETMLFFELHGLDTKVEPGNRVFPVTDKSQDVLKVLTEYASFNGKTEFLYNTKVLGLKKTGKKITAVETDKGDFEAYNFILTTGGKSHPETGSTGDGFEWLTKLGYNLNIPEPILVPITTKEKWVADLSGIALDMAGINVFQNGEKILTKKGKVLFTHFGLSGPGILNMSKAIGDALKNGEVLVKIDLMPGVGLDKIDEEFLAGLQKQNKKKLANFSWSVFTTSLWNQILLLTKISGDKKTNELTKEERFKIINIIKALTLTVTGRLGADKAIVTSGGVRPEDVDFKTMRSLLTPNLFFAGDILDFDRPSGGFSLQLCWTTGFVAGESAGQEFVE
ncbi:MAG: aminoacetone oxidase family FAD-binding enzyme [bacterium]